MSCGIGVRRVSLAVTAADRERQTRRADSVWQAITNAIGAADATYAFVQMHSFWGGRICGLQSDGSGFKERFEIG